MRKDRWQKIEDIFERAIALPFAERQKFVAAFCADDEELFREVWRLIEADNAEENFLDEQIFPFGMQIIETDEPLPEE